MYDSVDLSTIPDNPQAVAGYVGGHWVTYPELVKRFPHAHHLSVAVQADQHARCLDVEPGDATNDQASGWFHNHADRSQGKPIFYTSASNAQALINTLSRAGIGRDQYFLWSAHYTDAQHFCGPHEGFPQADLTQWTQHAHGRNLDQSIVQDDVFLSPRPPRKHPTGTAHFVGTFNSRNGRWTVRGTAGSFRKGTEGGKAVANVTFDETNGRWIISGEPWRRRPQVELAGSDKGKTRPQGTATFAGVFDTDKGTWTIRGTGLGNFQTGTKGGIAAAELTFDEKTGDWAITGKPWKRGPLHAVLHFLGLSL